MAEATATHELLAPRDDVWALVAEPFHLPDWWPAYTGVQPDRRGLAANARWKVVRARRPGLLRRGGGEGLIVVTAIAERERIAWHDVEERLDVDVHLEPAADGRTRVTADLRGPWWRLHVEGARHLPRRSVGRLYDLVQTAATL